MPHRAGNRANALLFLNSFGSTGNQADLGTSDKVKGGVFETRGWEHADHVF